MNNSKNSLSIDHDTAWIEHDFATRELVTHAYRELINVFANTAELPKSSDTNAKLINQAAAKIHGYLIEIGDTHGQER